MSHRPEVTSDRLRLGRVQNSTSSAQREKQAAHPPLTGRVLVLRMDHGR